MLFPAPPGITAHFHGEDVGAVAYRVVAFDEDGWAYVVSEEDIGLVTVRQYAARGGLTFTGLSDVEEQTLAVLPGGGWQSEYDDSDGNTWSSPVIAWAQRPRGHFVPLVDYDGRIAAESEIEYRLWHPDMKPVPPGIRSHPDAKTSEQTTTKESDVPDGGLIIRPRETSKGQTTDPKETA